MRTTIEREANGFLDGLNPVGSHQLCFLDVDKFRVLNSGYGYAAGEKLVREMESRLTSHFGKQAYVKRYSGDEFLLILPDSTTIRASQQVGNFQNELKNYRFIWQLGQHEVTVSAGIVQIESGKKLAELIQCAETACLNAKEKRRSGISVFEVDSGTFTKGQEEMHWVEMVNRAIEEDRLLLYYQPIVPFDPSSGERHFEILLRMRDKNGGIVAPGLFLPAIERFNLSAKLDRWVIQTVFSWLEAYEELLEMDYSWGINLSGHTLADSTLLNFVEVELKKKKIPPSRIYFEITETAAINNMEVARKFINELKRMGCRFALDDFGSGLSSFAYLKKLDIDFIKIDGQFVEKIHENEFDQEVVGAIYRIARAMNVKTIAEFVENETASAMLRQLGIDYGQGYGIAKPAPLHNFLGQEQIALR